ncbi:MAG TPA: class II aldolase/adducin family protein [Spirochaetia bacterium]|nr:class II aldolase/adducin family protein [Spirochaetia bacterium]
MKYEYMHPREQIVTIMRRVYGYGMTTTSGGNISILEDSGDIWITPGGIDKGTLSEGDIVRMRGDTTVEGTHAPSSEYPFHRAIYARRPDIRAVLHAHPSALVAFSLVRRIPDTSIIPQARSVCGTVGFAPYALPGTEELGRNLAETFARGFDSVLLENHGVATGGRTLLEAFQRFETLDFCARTLINASALGPARSLGPEEIALSQQGKNRALQEVDAQPRSSDERSLRRDMREVVHRAYRQRLMTSTEGTISARVDADSFLISPYGVDRSYIDESDFVLVRGGRRERGTMPSRAVVLHRAIYDAQPGINAIASAQGPAVTAFSVTGHRLDSATIPESYVVLRSIPLVRYGRQFTDEAALAREITPSSPVAFLENDAVLTTGATLTQAFDRLEVAEFSARAVLNAMKLGPIARIDEAALEAIEEKFGLV